MRRTVLLLFTMAAASASYSADEFLVVLPNTIYEVQSKTLGESPICPEKKTVEESMEWARKNCVLVSGPEKNVFIRVNRSISNFPAEISLSYYDDVLIYKTYEINVRSEPKKNGVHEFSEVTKKISEKLNRTPKVGRFLSSVAIDRMEKYIDFNHFADVASKVDRWEAIRSDINDVAWNSVVAFWNIRETLLIEARYQYDPMIGSTILVIVEDPSRCEISPNIYCITNKKIRAMAANPSQKADGSEAPQP